jgi:hypothetical protein
VRAVRQLFRRLRIALPQPLSILLGGVAYLPALLRDGQTRRAFREEVTIERTLRSGRHLAGFKDTTERVIEIPWVLRHVNGAHSLLDVGTAFAPPVMQRRLARLPIARKVGVDLAPFVLRDVESREADIRALPFADGEFDVAVCLSTLEHIGMDTSRYVEGDDDPSAGDDVTALRELGRVARTVLLTVPGGARADLGWQRQYSAERLEAAARDAGLQVRQLDIFVHDPTSGWRPAGREDLPGRSYGQGAPAAAALLCAALGR